MKNIIQKYFSDQPTSEDYLQLNKFHPPVCSKMIDKLEKSLGVELPLDYEAFLLTTNGYTGKLGESNVFLAKVEEILEFTDNYGGEYFPWMIFIGTDGGAEMYVLDKRTCPMQYGILPYIGGDEDFIPLGNTFEEFVCHLYYNDFWNQKKIST